MASISDVTGFMDWMNRNWQQSFAPIQDYSSFLLQLAVQKRQREMQLQDEARRTAERRAEAETERAFTRERDTAQQQFTKERDIYTSQMQALRGLQQAKMEMALEEARNKNAIDLIVKRLNLEHDQQTADQKEKARENMIKAANKAGANISQNATYEAATAAWIENQGKNYFNAQKRLKSAIAMGLPEIDMDAPKVQRMLAGMIADDEVVKGVLTPQEREAIRNDPSKIKSYRTLWSVNNKAKYNALVEADRTAFTTISAQLEKAAQGKPQAAAALAAGRQAAQEIDELLKEGGISPEQREQAFDDLLKVSNPPAQETQARPDRSQILQGMGAGGGTAVRPPAAVAPPGQWPGVVPLVQQAAGGMSPGQIALSPGQAALRVSTGAAPAIQEIAQAIASDPGVQGLGRIAASPFRATRYALYGGETPVWPTPEDLAVNLSIRSPSEAIRQILDRITQARMRTTTNDQAAAQNAIAPTAFPVLPPVFTGAP